MPPRASGPEGIILNYINEQNRPVNTQGIADALQTHGIKKASVQKVLDTLSDKGKISFKDYGKQRIYLAKQDQFEVLSAEERDQMTKENFKLQQELSTSKARNSELEAELRSIESHLTDDEIEEKVKQLMEEITSMESRLNKLKSGSVLVSPEEKKDTEESYNLKINLWKKRKRIFKDLWDMMSEALPSNSKEFREELGIETDEDVGTKFEDHGNLMPKRRKII